MEASASAAMKTTAATAAMEAAPASAAAETATASATAVPTALREGRSGRANERGTGHKSQGNLREGRNFHEPNSLRQTRRHNGSDAGPIPFDAGSGAGVSGCIFSRIRARRDFSGGLRIASGGAFRARLVDFSQTGNGQWRVASGEWLENAGRRLEIL